MSCFESSLILPAEDILSRLALPGPAAGLDIVASFVLIEPLAVRFLPIIGDLEDLELGDELRLFLGTSSNGVKGRAGDTRSGRVGG